MGTTAAKETVRDHLLVVAIDFGTSYSGYAYQFYHEYEQDPAKISSPQAWNGGNVNLISPKTPTCLLLNETKDFDKCYFGYEAEDKYMMACIEQRNHELFFYRRFKMLLQDGEGLTKLSKINDETGNEMLALDVFSLSIKCLKSHLLKMLETQGTGLDEKDIFWTLTVPAIWNDSAKQFMREAAQRAGIASEKLAIAFEPEAASIFCQQVPVRSKSGHEELVPFAEMSPGTKYMVVDLGGGTADITVHEKLEGNRLKEIRKASGGPWGGTTVDSAFFQMLISITGAAVMDRLRKEHTYDYLYMFREFEAAKRKFGQESRDKMIIKLPAALNDLCEKLTESSFKTYLAESVQSNNIYLAADKMIINPNLVEGFFRKASDQIVDHIESILKEDGSKNMSMILMVGGFSDSFFVQDVMRKTFHGRNGIQVFIPKDAGMTVVKGAVIFGRLPQSINTRVLRFTYGIAHCPEFIEGVHLEENKVVTDTGIRCGGIFGILVASGSNVATCFSKEMSFKTANDFQEQINVSVYYSKEQNPKYITDPECKLLGRLRVKIPNPSKGRRWVDVTYHFGTGELTINAVERSTKLPCTASFSMIE